MKKFALLLFLPPLFMPMVACKRESLQEKTKTTIQVSLTEAQAAQLPERLLLTGELKGQEDAWIAADTTGKVAAALVERGSTVRKGQALIRLECANYALDFKQADSGFVAAKAQYDQLKADMERYRILLDRATITRTDFDRVQTQFHVATANFEAAQARRDQARKRMDDSVIKAPFAGSIVERIVQVGEYVRPESKILRLVSNGPLRLTIHVPESAISRIKPRQTLNFQVAAFGQERFPGTVKFIPAGLNEQTRDFVVEAEVQNPEGKLRAGMFASAQLTTGETPGVVIPVEAVRQEGSNSKVYVAVNGKLQERLIETGETRDALMEVRKGLKAGEQVVKALTKDVRDGVSIQN